jgi:two-component system, chemotaxis family, chemotaxis protein CheY
MKILIVDDSLAARMLMSSFFEGIESYEIYEAVNGEEAVKTYKSEKPDITFLDLTMPVMNGFEALKIIKEFDPHATVIILTADVQKKSMEKIMELGAYTVIKKLPGKEEIFKIIEEIKKE